MINPL